MKLVIADTGPLIHLHQAQALDLLPLLGEVVVTPQVIREWSQQAPERRPQSPPTWLKIVSPSPAATARCESWVQSELLHSGEAESLAVALEIQPDWFLTDDAAAREFATTLNVETHGTLGVLLWACGQKWVSEVEATAILDRLEHSTLWLSRRVRAEVRQALKQLFPH